MSGKVTALGLDVITLKEIVFITLLDVVKILDFTAAKPPSASMIPASTATAAPPRPGRYLQVTSQSIASFGLRWVCTFTPSVP
jgi:hypothetical protein